MTDYPEWLVDRVAKALYHNAARGIGIILLDWSREADWLQDDFRDDARKVLDTLGFRENTARGILSAGGRHIYHPSLYDLDHDRKGIKTYSRWTAQTEWHEVEES